MYKCRFGLVTLASILALTGGINFSWADAPSQDALDGYALAAIPTGTQLVFEKDFEIPAQYSDIPFHHLCHVLTGPVSSRTRIIPAGSVFTMKAPVTEVRQNLDDVMKSEYTYQDDYAMAVFTSGDGKEIGIACCNQKLEKIDDADEYWEDYLIEDLRTDLEAAGMRIMLAAPKPF